MGKSLGMVDPPANTTASLSRKISLTLTFTPTLALQTKVTPSSSNKATRLSTTVFSNLKSGIPKRNKPPGFGSRSYTVTS